MPGSRIIGFFLCFKKKHYRKIMLGDYPAIQIYKNLFGKKYIFDIYEKPPDHPNCRCVVVEEREAEEALKQLKKG